MPALRPAAPSPLTFSVLPPSLAAVPLSLTMALISGCGSAPPVPEAASTQGASMPTAPISTAPMPTAPISAALSAPPAAPRLSPDEAVSTVHGRPVSDPFRPLEDLQTATPWLDAQNARTDAFLQTTGRPDIAERVAALFRIGTLFGPSYAGPHIFSLARDGERQQAALFVRTGDAAPRVLVDPESRSADGQVSIDWYGPSPSGALVVYGMSVDGDEVSTLRVRRVDTGEDLPLEIPFTRAASVAWLPDESGFYYTRYPGREAYDRHVYFHRLGDAPAQDARVVGPERLTARTDWPTVDLSVDGRYLAVTRHVSWSENTVHVLDRERNAWIDLAPAEPAIFGFAGVHDGALWATSSHGAPRGRVIRVDLKRPDIAEWRVVVPEDPDATLEGLKLVPGGLVTTHLRDGASQLTRHDVTSGARAPIALPAAGTAGGVFGRPNDPRLLVLFESFFHPPTLLSGALAGPPDPKTPLALDTLDRVASDFDPSPYVATRVEYPSYDGTQVPMWLIHRRDVQLDGDNPTLLYGYGGFAVSLTPVFSRNVLFWLEQGGVYAVANLRGGLEKGEAWHKAGKQDKKFQVFADFEYAMRYLIGARYTRPERLAIMGGSNGGLLVGAAITRAPYLFRAAVAKVGLLDMVRFHQWPPAELWTEEYGSPDNPEHFGFLWGYSPYHQIVDGVRYPAAFVHAAENDTRVTWIHSAKFVARLQEAQSGTHPILLRHERAAGHGAGKKKDSVAQEYVETYQFLLSQIGKP